jgi:hypothetical protein
MVIAVRKWLLREELFFSLLVQLQAAMGGNSTAATTPTSHLGSGLLAHCDAAQRVGNGATHHRTRLP